MQDQAGKDSPLTSYLNEFFAPRRSWALMGLVPVLALGSLSRLVPLGSLLWDKYLGDALYAIAFYLGFTLLWPRASPQARAVLTLFYVLVIEFFQLTGIPAGLKQSEHFSIRLFAYAVLGSHFSLWDILAYGVGIGAIVLLETWNTTQERSSVILSGDNERRLK